MHRSTLSLVAASMAALLVQASTFAFQTAPQTTSAPKPLVPTSASSIAMDPDAYYGQNVTLMAAVDQRFSSSAFSVDQDRTRQTTQDVLVFAPPLNGRLDLNAYVTVIGEVVRFDPDDMARRGKDYVANLAPELIEKYRGRPAIVATAVINGAMVDLARRPAPPMTADDEAYSRIMKRVGPAFTALRQAVAASKADDAATQTMVLKLGFADAEAFWKVKGKTDPTGWAQDARKQTDAIERGAAEGKWDEVKTAATSLGQSCTACHNAYRERVDDGTYRIKSVGQ